MSAEKERKIHTYIKAAITVVACCLFVILLSAKAAYAAPAEGATVEHSGTSGTVTWEIYTDGTMVIRPTSGDEGTMESLSGRDNGAPWYSKRSNIKRVETQGTVHLGNNAAYMFSNLSNCTEIDLSGLDTGGVTNMYYMFYNCSGLTSIDVSGFDTSKTVNMYSMFQNCSGLTSIDVSGFDTGSATNMKSMFSGCSGLTSLDVSEFDTGSVTNASYMFAGCSGLTSLDLSGFDTSNVTTMSSMFYNCSGLTFLDVSEFDTGNVTNMSQMFYRCSSLTSLDVSGFDTGNVTNMSQMFQNCSGLTSIDVSGFDTGNVTYMNSMFMGCSGLASLDVSGFDTGNVTNMSQIFYGCPSLTSLDVSGFDTGNVTNMSQMFNGCSKLTSLDVSGFDTGNVTNMSSMFSSCSKLTSLDVSGFDTGNVTNMSSMFSSCSKLTSLDVSGFDTGNATSMSYMFSNCNGLTSLDVSGFDTGNVTSMSSMFYNCSSLASLDASGFNTEKVTNMRIMFSGCRAITSLDISSFDTEIVQNMDQMFFDCMSLNSIDLGERFDFKEALLPAPPSATTTGKWIREDGTVDAKTPAELRDQYDANAAVWAGKWVWEEMPTKYTVKFNPPAEGGYAGSMPDQKIKAAEAGSLNANAFSRFDYSFDHWDGSDGRTYTDGQVIPANTFNVGDTLTLTAVFTKDQHALNFTDGEAGFTLKAGEKAVFPGIPGGASYQVWEETPSGWQLVRQSDPSGTIPANGTAEAKFWNEYVPGTATVALMAQKTIDGRTPEAGAFEFELLDDTGAVIETASNNAAGLVEFRTIVLEQPGTFVYSIREKRGDDDAVNYDAHTEVVTVTVEDDGAGNLTAVSSSATAMPSFSNETRPGMLQVTKRAQGGSGDEVFTFEIELTNEAGMPLDSVNIVGGQ